MYYRLAFVVVLLACVIDARRESPWLAEVLGVNFWSQNIGVTKNINVFCCPLNTQHKRHAFCTGIASNVTEKIINLCYTVTQHGCELLPDHGYQRLCLAASYIGLCSKLQESAEKVVEDHSEHSKKCKRTHLAELPLKVARVCDKAFKYAMPPSMKKADPTDETLCSALRPAFNQACTEEVYRFCSKYSTLPIIESTCQSLIPGFLCV